MVLPELLDDRRYRAAVPRLVDILESGGDVYLRAEAAVALVKIGDPAGLAAVEVAERSGPAIVRAAVGSTRRGTGWRRVE